MTLKTLQIANGDFVLNAATGRFRVVAGRDKARQDARLVLGKAPGFQGEGCGLDDLAGTVPASALAFRAMVGRAIRRGFEALAALEARYQLRDRDPSETIIGARGVLVWPVVGRPADYQFRADVQTAAGPPLSLGGTVRTPPA